MRLGRGEGGRCEIAVVFDGQAELLEHAAETRGAQRGRSHQSAALPGADFNWNAEQGDAGRRSCFIFGHDSNFFERSGRVMLRLEVCNLVRCCEQLAAGRP